jgi:hypothetical protein
MANDGFNGSTISFGSAVANLRGIAFDGSAAEVNVTSSTDTSQGHVAGKPKYDLSVDLIGGSTISAGNSGALAIAWFDGASDSLTKVVCVGRSIKGNMDGEITTTLKFANTTT